MHDNSLKCDCKIVWLAKWLLKYSHLAHETKCYHESKAQDVDMIKLSEADFDCHGKLELERDRYTQN